MSSRRLFFGLMPGDAVRDQIVNAAKLFPTDKSKRPVSRNNLHLTLLFLGDVGEKQSKCLENKVIQTYIQCFNIQLDLYGYFKKPKIAWIGCSSYPSELTRLVNHLKNIGVQCGIKINEGPYKPHVTLFRNTTTAEFPNNPIRINWNVNEFHLFESVPHENTTLYNSVASYALIQND